MFILYDSLIVVRSTLDIVNRDCIRLAQLNSKHVADAVRYRQRIVDEGKSTITKVFVFVTV